MSSNRKWETREDVVMPSVVDNPPPSSYTFCSELTPFSFASTSTSNATDSGPLSHHSLPPSPTYHDDFTLATALPMVQSRTHGKRREGYIPRPPNAFILFRSAFIRDQNVPGRVEGNHSTLSKIIGHYWRGLSPEERKKWEDRAVIAQEEHRAQYPDWRFRPAANALAKQQKEASSTSRKRGGRARRTSSPDEDGDETPETPVSRGKGKAKELAKSSKGKSKQVDALEETRCATIAGFVADGIKGEDLEFAVKRWEDERKVQPSASRSSRSRSIRGVESVPRHSRSQSSTVQPNPPPNPTTAALKPAAPSTIPLDVPLTAMYKRSLSAPASDNRPPLSPESSSQHSDDSSADNMSPATVDYPKNHATWPAGVPTEPSTLTRSGPSGGYDDARRSDMPFQAASASTTTTTTPATTSGSFDQPPVGGLGTWQKEASRAPIDRIPTSDTSSWWPQGDSVARPDYEFEQGDRLSTSQMGYDGGHQFDRSYITAYPYQASHSASQALPWSDVSAGRQGVAAVIEEETSDCQSSTPVAASPCLSIPSLTSANGGFYYPTNTVSPTTSFSSFSSLTDWAGDYKYASSGPWSTPPMTNTPTPSGWYTPDGSSDWARVEVQGHSHGPTTSADDWDRAEYQAARARNLDVGQQQETTFQAAMQRSFRPSGA